MNMFDRIEYVTVINPVFEVTLLGTAQAHIWQEYLKQEGFEHANTGDEIDITISTVDSYFKGIRFQEFSISLKIHENCYFLAHAYNSIALFAYAERTVFRTPYYKGDITIRKDYLSISHRQSLCFEAQLPHDAPVLSREDECDDLVVYLPRRLRKKPDQPHCFYARLEGASETFDTSNITITQPLEIAESILNMLKISRFEVNQWRVRQGARHRKSKTYNIAKTRHEMC